MIDRMMVFFEIQLFIVFLFTVNFVNSLWRQDLYWSLAALIGLVSAIIAGAMYAYEMRVKKEQK